MISVHFSCCMVSDKKSSVIFNSCSSTGKVFCISGFFQNFPLVSGLLQVENDMPRCWFFGIYMLGGLWASWVSGLESSLILENSQPLLLPKFLLLLSVFLLVFPLHICYTLCICPTSFSLSSFFFPLPFLFLLAFQFGMFNWHIFKLTDNFLCCV